MSLFAGGRRLRALKVPRYYSTRGSIYAEPPKRSFASYTMVGGSMLFIGYLLGAILPQPKFLQLAFPRPTQPPPHMETEDGKLHLENLEGKLEQLPIVQQLKAQKVTPEDAERFNIKEGSNYWKVFRPYENDDDPIPLHSLTRHSLRSTGGLPLLPLVFANPDRTEFRVVVYLGPQLCGHPGIIHGGLLATLCDEGQAMPAFYNLPSHVAVTASLNMKYRKPTEANQFVVLESQLGTINGRRANCSAKIKTPDGLLLVESDAVFVEPKWAGLIPNLNKKWMQ